MAVHRVGPNPTQLANLIRYDDKMPSYEVWNYAFPGLEDYAIYVFGTAGGSGTFRMVNSLEELIPNAAFSKSHSILVHNETADKFEEILPGSVLQMIYYEKLIDWIRIQKCLEETTSCDEVDSYKEIIPHRSGGVENGGG